MGSEVKISQVKSSHTLSELRSCVKVEVDVLGSRPVFCGCKAILNHQVTHSVPRFPASYSNGFKVLLSFFSLGAKLDSTHIAVKMNKHSNKHLSTQTKARNVRERERERERELELENFILQGL